MRKPLRLRLFNFFGLSASRRSVILFTELSLPMRDLSAFPHRYFWRLATPFSIVRGIAFHESHSLHEDLSVRNPGLHLGILQGKLGSIGAASRRNRFREVRYFDIRSDWSREQVDI